MSGSICKAQIPNICKDKIRNDGGKNNLVKLLNIFIEYLSKRQSSKKNYLYLYEMDDHLLRDIGLDRDALHQIIRRRDWR